MRRASMRMPVRDAGVVRTCWLWVSRHPAELHTILIRGRHAAVFPMLLVSPGVFEAILSEEDAVISDELNHASIIDGGWMPLLGMSLSVVCTGLPLPSFSRLCLYVQASVCARRSVIATST